MSGLLRSLGLSETAKKNHTSSTSPVLHNFGCISKGVNPCRPAKTILHWSQATVPPKTRVQSKGGKAKRVPFSGAKWPVFQDLWAKMKRKKNKMHTNSASTVPQNVCVFLKGLTLLLELQKLSYTDSKPNPVTCPPKRGFISNGVNPCRSAKSIPHWLQFILPPKTRVKYD